MKTFDGYKKQALTDVYALLAGGGHKLISSLSVNYASSAGNADTLDGAHLNGVFTAFGNNKHNITATIGGVTKEFQVNYASDADKLDGYHANKLLTALSNSNNGISITVGGTTKSISNISVNYAASAGNANTAQYLRSLGNQNCQTGRTQNYGDVYTYNTYDGNTGSPTTFTSVIGFGRGIAGTVEIAGGWDNTNLYWRSLRDCCEDWHSWRTVLDSNNYTEFINNYYWANVKISASYSTTTSPTVHTLTATRVCAGYTKTDGFGITPYYLSDSVLLPTISLDDGYTYRCLEIDKSTKISCIIADRVFLPGSIRGILLNFKEGYDGQIVLLKDLQNYGGENGYFWVMPSGCAIIGPEGSSTKVTTNQISNTYDDGKSRFFVYSSKYRRWIEFYCG